MPPAPEDEVWIRCWRRAIARESAALAALCAKELDRPPFEVLMSDIVPLLDACRWHEKNARRVLRPRRVRNGGLWRLGQRHTLQRQPLGHVAIIATWNYPYQLMGIQLLQAIASGNRVTVKPSERSPKCQLRLLGLARDAGLDEARLSWTQPTREAGRDLLELGQFDLVVFTGSTGTGRAVASRLADSLTPSVLELSGSDSAIVLDDADATLAAESIYFAVTLNAGQSCMAPRRVIVERGIADAFVEAFARKFEQEPRVRTIRGAEADRCRELVERACSEGGEIRTSGPPPDDGFSPTAVLSCPAGSEIAESDHFGPAIAVIRSSSRDETLRLAQRPVKSLASSIFTSNPGEAETVAASLDASFVTINDCVLPTAHPGVSIAGRGLSGWGVTRGELGLLAMTRPQFLSTTSSRVRVPTADPGKQARVRIERFVRWWYSR